MVGEAVLRDFNGCGVSSTESPDGPEIDNSRDLGKKGKGGCLAAEDCWVATAAAGVAAAAVKSLPNQDGWQLPVVMQTCFGWMYGDKPAYRL